MPDRPLLGFSLLALLALGCSDPREDEPPRRANGAVAGGDTSDFTGNAEACLGEREETLEDEPALGFSVGELLAASAGEFDVPLRWQDRCRTRELATSACDAPAGFQLLHDQETIVRMGVRHAGPARVIYPTDEQVCAQSMFVPVTLKLESTDGVLATELPAQLWSECGSSVDVGFHRPLSDVQGRLSDPSLGFPTGSQVEFTAGFFSDRMWFDLYVVSPERDALFGIAMPPYGQGWTHDVPRAQVELQPGAPLTTSHCRSTGGVTY